jgi:UDP-N-acetylglucosamine 4,6-dehydratase
MTTYAYNASTFSGKTLLITGGTGTFGNAVLRRFLRTGIGEIRVFSRDEKKQEEVRMLYNDPKIKSYIGDVRAYDSTLAAMRGVDFVFHAAALKQVPSCEFYPLEALRTNALGAENVMNAAIQSGVQKVIVLSTDKAVYPINAMGMSKALMEKTAQAFSRNHPESSTTVCITRYGNVMYSRGSVIPLFVRQIKAKQPLTVTEPSMTRFMMSLGDSVGLVEFAFQHGQPGDILIRKAPACTISTLVSALGNVFGIDPDVDVIGIRHGEKLHEALASSEEMSRSTDEGDYLRIDLDARDLNYAPYSEQGEPNARAVPDFGSDTTTRLSISETEELLRTLPEIRQQVEELDRR